MKRGFAIIYALAALCLLGAVISIVGVGANERMRSLADGPADAQLRQLLIAGAELSRAGASGEVLLPEQLRDGVSLRIVSERPDSRIVANFHGRGLQCPIPR